MAEKIGVKIVSGESALETNVVYSDYIHLELLYLIDLIHFLVWCRDP